jgi:hypothetical protein
MINTLSLNQIGSIKAYCSPGGYEFDSYVNALIDDDFEDQALNT